MRASKTQQGLTLIELLIAMTVLAIGLIGMLTMQTEALKASRAGRHVSDAARIAEDELEFLHRQPWTAIPPSPWSAPRTVNITAVAAGPSVAQAYALRSRVVAGPAASLRLIDVEITWVSPEAPAGSPGNLYALSSVRHDDP